VQALHQRRIAGHRVVAAHLPTVFGAALAQLDALLRQHRPALVICVGQAGGRAVLSLERVAINLDDARIADNAAAAADRHARGARRPGGVFHDAAGQGHVGNAAAPGHCRPRCRRPPAPSSATTCSTD
jgi:hypothetical protein